jgi:hypothetical protein
MKDLELIAEQLERIAVATEELNAKINKFLLRRFEISHD